MQKSQAVKPHHREHEMDQEEKRPAWLPANPLYLNHASTCLTHTAKFMQLFNLNKSIHETHCTQNQK